MRQRSSGFMAVIRSWTARTQINVPNINSIKLADQSRYTAFFLFNHPFLTILSFHVSFCSSDLSDYFSLCTTVRSSVPMSKCLSLSPYLHPICMFRVGATKHFNPKPHIRLPEQRYFSKNIFNSNWPKKEEDGKLVGCTQDPNR